MVGPIINQVPLVGPLRPDAGIKEQEERRIIQEQSRKVSPPRDENGETPVSDEILTAEGVIAEFAKGVNSPSGRLSIDEDKDSGDFIYRIIDSDTGEVLQQWPRDELLRWARLAKSQSEGLLVDKEA